MNQWFIHICSHHQHRGAIDTLLCMPACLSLQDLSLASLALRSPLAEDSGALSDFVDSYYVLPAHVRGLVWQFLSALAGGPLHDKPPALLERLAAAQPLPGDLFGDSFVSDECAFFEDEFGGEYDSQGAFEVDFGRAAPLVTDAVLMTSVPTHDDRGLGAAVRLHLAGCLQVTGSGLLASVSPSLTALDLSGCGGVSEDDLLCVLRACPHVRDLNLLQWYTLGTSTVESISELVPRLRGFALSGAWNLAQVPRLFPWLFSISVPRVDGVNNEFLEEIGQHCKAMLTIDIKDAWEADDDGLRFLKALPALEKIDFSGCSHFSPAALSQAFEPGFTNLLSLDLSGTLVSDEALVICFDVSVQLERLCLAHTASLTSAALDAAAARLNDLIELELPWSRALKDPESVCNVVRANPHLAILDIGGCRQLGDDHLEIIAACSPHLHALSIGGCRKLTDDGVALSIAGLSELRLLRLAFCRQLSDRALDAIRGGCVHLEEITITGNPRISRRGIDDLKQSCPFITSIDDFGTALGRTVVRDSVPNRTTPEGQTSVRTPQVPSTRQMDSLRRLIE
jgi:hypothetical protein